MTEDQKKMAKRMPTIDIVMTHYNRLDYLKRTLEALCERTQSKYTLSIVDDGSTDGSQEYVQELYNQGILKCLIRKKDNWGYYSAINCVVKTVNSPFFVFMTDDTILPDVEPDWLQRLWQEFDWCLDLGLLGLNNPTAIVQDRDKYNKTETIQFTSQINSNVIMFRNRPHTGYDQKVWRPLPANDKNLKDEMTPFSQNCMQSGHKLGYLMNTYSLHIGEKSSMGIYENDEYPKNTFVKTNPKTLEPI